MSNGQMAQQTYWNQLVLVKVVSCYVRRYRDEQTRWIKYTGLFKAAVTSSTIGAWAVWKEYAFVWGVFLAVAQVLDAAKDYLPQTKHMRAASDFVAAIEGIFIEARYDWFSVYSGKFPPDEIMAKWKNLAKMLNDAESKHFPDGLPENKGRQALAEADASTYFQTTYGVGD